MTSKKAILALGVAIVLLLSALLALCMPGCGKTEEARPAQETPTPVPAVTPTTAPAPEQPAAADEVDRLAQVQAMLPVMDAAIRALRSGEAMFYDAADAELVWNTLYCLCVNSGVKGIEEDVTAGTMTVPAQTMAALAAVCFAEYTTLPAVPEDMAVVSFSSDAQAYTLELSDAGQSGCEITDTVAGEDGAYTAWVAYLDESEETPTLIETYLFELRPNTDAAEALYPMRVLAAYDACNTLAQVVKCEGTATDIRLELEHVQVLWKEDPADPEVYTSEIQPTGQPNETMRLTGMDAVDLNTLCGLLEAEPDFKDADAAFAWFMENYTREVMDGPILYQMRTYGGVVYSMAPLYGYYFAG